MVRAVCAALAVYTYVNAPFGWAYRDIFMCADKYVDYITHGIWPKEAVDQIGKSQASNASEQGQGRQEG